MLQPLRETFNENDHPNLLVGLGRADDAAVYQINEQQAIISTTDFFPPVVDDPYDFGAIAAANALSDVYAMGGRVLFAINLVAFPADLDKGILREILRGGAEKVAEAGGVIAGGHTVTDPEPKYGLAVTGSVDPQRVKRKGGAQDGDVLLLTKPLGVGVITTALKRNLTEAYEVAAAVESMKILNRQAAEAAILANAHSMTDITGFGLLGHAHEMARNDNVDFHFAATRLPWLDGARKYGERRVFPGGMGRNREHFGKFVTFGDQIDAATRNMLWTPETSGGLLIAVAPSDVATVQENCPSAVVIGRITSGSGRIIVE